MTISHLGNEVSPEELIIRACQRVSKFHAVRHQVESNATKQEKSNDTSKAGI